ncbi:MAG: DUF4956 domain-containing protein [Planctomycetales bacterium]|nr:DUF4956 domain-containing protein [Planctomycetales bacterium]
MDSVDNALRQLTTAVTVERQQIALLTVHLVLAGMMALVVRVLFRRFSVSASGTDSISRVFPLLAIITTAIIAVVKSSLALSLGLVGALSIVRFRSAIKEPEELIYLFLCIAIGLALGAEQVALAICVVTVCGVFAGFIHVTAKAKPDQNLLLTISGDTTRYFSDDGENVLTTVGTVAGKFTVQRCDVEHDRSEVRLVLSRANPDDTPKMINRLRAELPDCELSYVNLNSTL